MDVTRPINIAVGISRKIIPNIVTEKDRIDIQSLLKMDRMSLKFTEEKPDKTIKTVMAGMGICSISGAKNKTISNIHRPVRTPDNFVFAPLERFKAVIPMEAPTGIPLNKPEAILAAPWASISCEVSTDPSSFSDI